MRKQLARHYLNERRLDDAEKELRAIAAAQPADLAAGLDVVRFLQVIRGGPLPSKNCSRASTARRISRIPDRPRRALCGERKIPESIRLLERLIATGKSKDDVIAAQVKLAELHVARRTFDQAEPLINTILENDRRNMTGLKLRAVLHMEAGRLDTAVGDLRQALNDQPHSAELMSLLALAYERTGAIELADRHFASGMRGANFDPRQVLNTFVPASALEPASGRRRPDGACEPPAGRSSRPLRIGGGPARAAKLERSPADR